MAHTERLIGPVELAAVPRHPIAGSPSAGGPVFPGPSGASSLTTAPLLPPPRIDTPTARGVFPEQTLGH